MIATQSKVMQLIVMFNKEMSHSFRCVERASVDRWIYTNFEILYKLQLYAPTFRVMEGCVHCL